MCRGNGERRPRANPPHASPAPTALLPQLPSPFTASPPRSSASNRIIGAKDHASIQMNVAEVSSAVGGSPSGERGLGRPGRLSPKPQT